MTRKENQEKEQENKMAIIIERKTGEKNGKKGVTEPEISREAGTNSPQHHTPIPFVGPVCDLTLILPW